MVAAVTEQEAESSAAKFVMMLLFTMKQKQICFNSIQFNSIQFNSIQFNSIHNHKHKQLRSSFDLHAARGGS